MPDYGSGQEVFAHFITRYRYDLAKFVREVFGVEPWPWQLQVMAQYDKCIDGQGRISVRSGHGVGKSTLEAWMMCHRLACFFPQKTIVTAPTTAQLFDALWAEFKTQLSRMPKLLLDQFEVKAERVELLAAPSESFVSARTSRKEQPEAMQGVHCNDGWVLLLGDEAAAIPDKVFEAGAGSMAGPRTTTFLAGNPNYAAGFFFDTHTKLAGDEPGMWWTLKVATTDIDQPWTRLFAEDIERRYGRDSNAYRVRVLGEFPTAEDKGVIPFYLVEAATKRQLAPPPNSMPVIWGLDCARFGFDRSALAKRRSKRLLEPVAFRTKLDTMQLAAWVQQEYNLTRPSDRPVVINIDVLNMGSGVVDRLIQLGLPARGINVSESPSLRNKKLYANLRAELWFRAKEWFEALDCWMPTQEDLIEELTRPQYDYREATGRMLIEKKEITAAKLGRSPDLADAFILTFAADEGTLIHGTKYGISSWKAKLTRPLGGMV